MTNQYNASEIVKRNVSSIPNVMTCDINMYVSRATADFKWQGKQLTHDLWQQVLAFFEWTQSTAHSESQVRLYVNSETGEWAAWAFPQEKGTGMAVKEIPDHPTFAANRARFGPEWFYYGTVHHHCSSSAFQSGTDRMGHGVNSPFMGEEVQDGLHITVGKIGSSRYDLDARLYQSGFKLALEMDEFWNIGDEARAMLPDNLHHQVAMFQMCLPPPKDFPFPEEWKVNYIVPPPPPVTTVSSYNGNVSTVTKTGLAYTYDTNKFRKAPGKWDDAKQGAYDLARWLEGRENTNNLSPEDTLEVMEEVMKSPLLREMARLIWLYNLELVDIMRGWRDHVEDLERAKSTTEKQLEKVEAEHEEAETKLIRLETALEAQDLAPDERKRLVEELAQVNAKWESTKELMGELEDKILEESLKEVQSSEGGKTTTAEEEYGMGYCT